MQLRSVHLATSVQAQELTEKDVAVQSCALGRAGANVGPPLLPLSDVAPGDIEHQPVSPFGPLRVIPTGSIRIWMMSSEML